MKRKIILMLCIAASMTCYAACGNKSTQDSAKTDSFIEKDIVETETQELQDVEVLVFYPNYEEMTINQAKTMVAEITPQNLCQELSYYEVMSADVQVESFNIKDNQGSIELYLNVTKEYKSFLEAAVLEDGSNKIAQKQLVQALANTFLQAYEADYIKVTVEGGILITDYYSFEEPLSFVTCDEVFDDMEGYCYSIIEGSMMSEDENFTAVYPQFTEVTNGALMGPFNQIITDWVKKYMNSRTGAKESVFYEVHFQTENFVSFVLRGNRFDDQGEVIDQYIATFNFDFKEENVRRLKNMADIGHVIECLEVGSQYQMTGQSKMTLDEFKEYVQLNGCDDFMITFLDYDYELGNSAFNPTGYSYFNREGKLVVIFKVGAEKGYFAEVLFDNEIMKTE